MKKPLLAMLAAGLAMSVSGQAFQNLGFESANVSNPGPLHSVPFSNAFSNWQAVGAATYPSLGRTNLSFGPITRAYYDSSDLDQVTIGIYDIAPIQGTYSAWVEADLGSLHTGVVHLFQTGLVPDTARSLRFTTSSYSSLAGFSEQLSLQINGTDVPFVPTLVQSNGASWAADISNYANTLAELRFIFRADYPLPGFYPHVFVGTGLDAINFSPLPVPEPRTILLLALGFSAILLHSCRR